MLRISSLILFISVFLCGNIFAQISLTTPGSPYTQNFNTLSNTAGSTTNVLAITGWSMTETGGGARDNEQYGVDTGGSTTGDTYSYGTAAAVDRAFGGLRSGTLIANFGASFTNNTGATVTSLDIAYTGEQWRLGTISRTDQLSFEYSTDASSLTTGIWTNVSALNFVSPYTAVAGARDGNAAANRTALSTTLTGLSIANGATFWIRWTDVDATGADDGLSVDDFSIAVTPLPIDVSIADVSQVETNSGTTTFAFTVSLSNPANFGGVTFDIATANNTASSASDYTASTLTSQTIAAGSSSYTFNVSISGDATCESDETFFVNITNATGLSVTVTDNQALGTITNDETLPVDPTVTPASICDAGTVNLAASSPSGTYDWYDASSGGTFQGSGSPFTTTSISTTTDYWVETVIDFCKSSRIQVTATVNTTPTADAPSNVTACDSYTLPSLTVGNYFTGTGGTGTALSAGNSITSSQTIYVYAETGTTPNCTDENSFTVTINTTPTADAPSNVTACDTYTLPSLTVGNYFTGTGGTGTALSAGNSITSSQTIYVYAETGTTPNCTDENSFTVTINTTPTADAPSNVTACDTYTLPALTVGNYFTGTGGTGTALSAGNSITSSQTIYVYAETGTTPNCTDENSFTVTINTTPTADAPSNVTACDSYTLPALTVGNYFTGTGGTGTALSAGNNITSSQTIYVYAETGTTPNCTDENSFTVTINTTPTADAPGNVTACDSYTLPALTVGNYFTGTGGTGTALSAGNNITSSQTIYVYAETGTTPNCTDENSFTVTINTTPTADAPGNVTACDSYTLPALTVGNYFTGTGGTGTALSAGNNITSSQTIYVYAETGTTPNCTDENSFTVTINTTPTADAPGNVTACDSYTLPALTVGNYFTGTGGTGTALSAGNSITSSQTIYVYAETGTTPNCSDENSFTVTINTTPTADAPSNVTACDSYTLPALTVGNYFTGTGGTGTALSAGNNITSSQTIYVYAETGTTPNCSDENSFVVTIEDCSQLTTGSCGASLTTMADALYSDAVAGATNYRYWVQNAATGYSYISVRAASDNLFRMSWISANAAKYGTTYTVRVSAYVAGAWQSYGTPCNVTTPPTRLQPSSCGITVANLTDAIYCYPVVGATSYRFQVVHAGSSFNKIATSNVLNNNFFRMSWFTSDVLPGATYTVTVQAYANGSWSAYGPSCTITTPSTLTKLATASCNISVPALTTALYSDAVAGATNFRYEVVNVGAGFSKIATRAASDNLFRLSWLTGIQLNTTYTIRVSAYLNGIWQAYGTACTVTTPAAIMADEEIVLEHNNGLSLGEELVLETFPNPNTGSFTVSTNAAGRFKLTNEIGQLIQTLEITEENGFQTKVEGLGAGVYFVTGIVNEMVLTKKIIVQ